MTSNRRQPAFPMAWAVAALAAASLACNAILPPATRPVRPTPQTTAPPAATEALPTPNSQALGLSRSQPHPRSETYALPNWEVQVLEMMRGREAWRAIQAANQFNDPAPEGLEYLLLRLRVRSAHADDEVHEIDKSDFKVTGDRLIRYFTAPVVTPGDRLEAELRAGETAEGWSAYLVGQEEGNLILVLDEIGVTDRDQIRFMALDEGAAVGVPPELAEIEPTATGVSRDKPAPLGETVRSEDWEITVLQVVRGAEAWELVEQANRFNDPPAAGLEYVAVRVKVRYINPADQPAQIDGFNFHATGASGTVYDNPVVVKPEPELRVTLYPGGQYQGWVVLQVAVEETGLVAVFKPLFDLSGENQRFLRLEP